MGAAYDSIGNHVAGSQTMSELSLAVQIVSVVLVAGAVLWLMARVTFGAFRAVFKRAARLRLARVRARRGARSSAIVI